jgi:hypothetical protein
VHGIDDAEADLLEQVSTLASSGSVLCAEYEELATPAAATDGNSNSDLFKYDLEELRTFHQSEHLFGSASSQTCMERSQKLLLLVLC